MKKKTAAIVALSLQLAISGNLLAQDNRIVPTKIGRVYIENNYMYRQGDESHTSLTGDQLVGALYNSSFDGRYVLFGGAKKEDDLLLADLSLYILDIETKAITNVGQWYSIQVVAGSFSPNAYDLAMVDGKGRLYIAHYGDRVITGSVKVIDDGEDVGLACIWNESGRRVAVPKISINLEAGLPRTWAVVDVGPTAISFFGTVQHLSELPDFNDYAAENPLLPDACSPVSGTVTDLALRLPWPAYHASANCGGSVNAAAGQYSVSQAYCGSSHTGWQVDFRLPSNSPVTATAAGTVSSFANYYGNTCNADCSVCTPNNGTYVKLLHTGTAGNQWYSWYLHLTPPLSTKASTPGAAFAAGEFIACSDTTGSACGAHLHFEMKKTDGTQVRPVPMHGVELSPDTYPITDFTVNRSYQAPLASPAPSPIAPANNSTGQSTTPIFSWPSVTGASSYRIVVGTSASALDVLDDPTSAGPSAGSQGVVINTTSTPNNFTPPTALSTGTTYYWRIKGRGSFYGDSSARFQFTTAGGPTPPNDQCSSAITLSAGVTRVDNTANATPTGDPTPSCRSNFGKGVWYTFTPATSGIVTVSTCGSNFDTVVQVYTGSCGALSAVVDGCNDDNGPACSGTQASVSFSGTGGTAYRIIAGGYGAASGSLQIVASLTSSETVSTPTTPSGTTSGSPGASYTYFTGGSSSSLGHSVQYQFDWGDGTTSSWLAVGGTSTTHSWSSPGTYPVRAHARCATHTSVVSSYSSSLSVNIMTTGSAAKPDFDRDGNSDILWQSSVSGQRFIWLMNGTQRTAEVYLGTIPTEWQIVGAGDFNKDGNVDILWQSTVSGRRYIWLMNGTQNTGEVFLGTIPTEWQIVGAGDFNKDGNVDILWQSTVSGRRYIWLMNGTQNTSEVFLGTIPTEWQIVGAGDFNRDGNVDILWQSTVSGQRYIWLMNGTQNTSEVFLGTIPTEWKIAGAGDFSRDGNVDILWQSTVSGQRYIWLMNGTQNTGEVFLGTIPTEWDIRNH